MWSHKHEYRYVVNHVQSSTELRTHLLNIPEKFLLRILFLFLISCNCHIS